MFFYKKLFVFVGLLFAFCVPTKVYASQTINIETDTQIDTKTQQNTILSVKSETIKNNLITIIIADKQGQIKEITLEIERNKTPLLDIENEDENYTGKSIALDETNRDLLERLVMGEAGTQGYIGAALVAQTIHDTMLYEDNYSVLDIKKEYAYAGELDTEPNEDVKKAVAYIFDDGKMAVQHELRYFYAPKLTDSYFHENQNFVVEYKGHRFFMEQTKE